MFYNMGPKTEPYVTPRVKNNTPNSPTSKYDFINFTMQVLTEFSLPKTELVVM